jgi:hypothetical protein
LRPRTLCSPAKPSDEGGLEDLVEFFFRPANSRCRSAIFRSASPIFRSASAICFSRSATLWQSPSFSRSNLFQRLQEKGLALRANIAETLSVGAISEQRQKETQHDR